MRRLLPLAPLIVAIALPFVEVQACGPDFFPDVFVRNLHADHPADYAAGKLGVLLPTYPRADLSVAYRYLIGGTLTAEEQRAYHPTLSLAEEVRDFDDADANEAQAATAGTRYAEPPGPADLWLRTRNQYAPPQPDLHPVTEYGNIYSSGFFLAASYENCQADAFRTAIVTLKSRAKTWGAHSPELADWIKGQDAVFSNCGANGHAISYPAGRPVINPSSPTIAPSNAPALLRQDREYQIAAAQFYSAQFGLACVSFQAIAKDATSPWRGIARYLVARSLIREAFLTAKNGPDDVMASFDPDLMKQAQRELESMRGEQLPGVSSNSVQGLLNLVRLRTEPQVRLREMSADLAGPKTDPNYKQDLEDLTWYLNGKLDSRAIREDAWDSDFDIDRSKNHFRPITFDEKIPGFEKAFHDVADLRSTSQLIDWLVTFQSPSEAARKHAFAEWKRTGNVPWLAAAIMKASSSDPGASALIEGAGHVQLTSPAWATVTYHRLRLLIDTGHSAEARTELDKAFPGVRAIGSESSINLFTGLRMRTASSLNDALADAPRKILERTSEEHSSIDECLDVMKNPKRKYDCKKDNSPVEFSKDAAAVFNNETPLATLAQAAQSGALPTQLRQSVAMMVWVRSVLLKNEVIAAQMLPLLPQKLQQQAGVGVGFHPLMAILRNPGLRPYLDGGVQRSASYDFVESYADNWWCGNWTTNFSDNGAPIPLKSIAFLSPEMRTTGEKETKALLALGSADENLGSGVLNYARAHPSDSDVPEALFLTLRMIRFGCHHGWGAENDKQNSDHVTSIAQEVGALMRRRYPTNQWTKKAAPYVWLGDKNG
ncbi:MAG: hypothetical protein WCA89_13870 [Terracidiphilus sp.]|jgi:hypothetical protein